MDDLLPLREALFGHLRERYRTMFGSRFEFLLYDVTSTCFAGQCERNPQAQRWYIQLTDVEDAFRVGKSDLGLRPVYHHREDRVQAHILVCFRSPAMWRCLEMWLRSRGLGDCGRQVLEQMATIHSMDVVLPVKGNADARLRLVAKPERLTSELLSRMQLKLPSRLKTIENVVEKTRGK